MQVKPGYKQTEVGVLPKEWELKRLRDVAQIRSGIAKNSNTSIPDPIRVHYLRVANVQDGYLDLSEMGQLEVSRGDLQRFAVLPGDVLMNEGGDRDKLGRGSIWRGELQPCVHQNHVFVVRCGRTLVPEYLNIWSSGSAARQYFLVAGKQTTNLASINKTSLGELPVAVPNDKEQRAIAEALSDVDALLGALDRLIAKKRDIKQAAMQQLLTGQTRLPGFVSASLGYKQTEVGLIPTDWDILPFERIAHLERGKFTARPRNDPKYYGGEIPFIQTGDVTNSRGKITTYSQTLNCEGLKVSKLFPRGTLFFTIAANIGDVGIASFDTACPDSLVAITPANSTDKIWLYYELARRKSSFEAIATHNAQLNINLEKLRPYFLPRPPLMEQTAIAEVLTDMDAELAALELRREKTRAVKQGMMQELLTGRIRLVHRGPVKNSKVAI